MSQRWDRTLVFAACLALITAAVQGCGSEPYSFATWRGKTIEVRGADGVSLNAGQERAEVEVQNHRILITETEITLDGKTKAVAPFSRIVIQGKPDQVSVIVDGKALFP